MATAAAARERTDHRDWWQRAHPAAWAEEVALGREAAKIAAWRKHESHGTPETLIKASRVKQGALARLFMAGHISIDQLAWSAEIRAVIERIGRDVTVRSISLETRVDNGFAGNQLEEESLGRVRAEVAYSRWRAGLVQDGAKAAGLVLAIIAEDRAVRSAARAFGMRDITARALLTDALDLWPDCYGWARDRVDENDLVRGSSARPSVASAGSGRRGDDHLASIDRRQGEVDAPGGEHVFSC